MRLPWALLIMSLTMLSMGAAADPTIVSLGSREAGATWTFSTPGNYTLVNTTIQGSSVSLAQATRSVGDTALPDFSQALRVVNVDLTTNPGDIVIANTSQPGPPTNVTIQPTSAELEDTFIHHGGGGNTNYGTSSDLWVGYWGNPEWNRALIRLATFPLPGNATVLDAHLDLYMYAAATTESASIAVHRVTTAWLELGATWNDYDGSNPWNAALGGGDFDATSVDVVGGITNATGWYSWNITSLVRDWTAGTYPNDGLLLRSLGDDARLSTGRKQFFSSDAPNATLRPRIRLEYAVAGSGAEFESRMIDAGGAAAWGRIWWNATTPPSTSATIRTRTGFSSSIDASWSPWSAPYAGPGAAVGSAGRYLQYRVALSTATATSPSVHDAAASFTRYASQGAILTDPLLPPKLETWGRFDASWSGPVGTVVVAAYSEDGGISWRSASPGTNLTGTGSGAVQLRFTLTTDNTTRTPVLVPFSLSYSISSPSAGGLTLPTVLGLPIWVLLIPFVLLAAWVLARDLRPSPFHATDLLLIHTDGRLVRRVGGDANPIRDEVAVSGMFTIVARFVKDSFGGEDGGGALRSFQVDDKEVSIAHGDYLFLALVGKGIKPAELETNMVRFLKKLEQAHEPALRAWDGFASTAAGLDAPMHRFLTKGYRHRPLFSRSAAG